VRTTAEQNDFTSLFAGFVQRGFVFWLASVASIDGDPGGLAVAYLGENVMKNRAEVRTSLGARGGRQVLLDDDMIHLEKAWVVDDVTDRRDQPGGQLPGAIRPDNSQRLVRRTGGADP
jgi:hypothetical protein